MIKLGRIVLKKLKVINKINQFSFDTNKKNILFIYKFLIFKL